MTNKIINESTLYIGVDDKTLDLFESQYIIPNGVSYNSYVILDDKVAVMDTVDIRATEQWLKNLEASLKGKPVDYLIVSHMEPDHGASIQILADMYPSMKIVGNAKTFTIMNQFFEFDLTNKAITVKEGDTLCLGSHTLQFFMAPMVHWPEVMVTYEQSSKVLFSADAFGKFGTLDTDEDWTCEARRYYFNIVGKYGIQVQSLLKKVSALDIKTICPLHGPILNDNLAYYIDKYNTWSSYMPEDDGVFIAYASIHGNTANAAKQLAEIFDKKGAKKVSVFDLSREDMAEAVEDAFRYDKLIVAASSYDGGVFPVMEDFLLHLKSKNYQNRKIGIMENGTWAPSAAKTVKAIIENYKNVELCGPIVSIRSTVRQENIEQMKELADSILSE